MQVLLINQNATIERLAKLSSGKLGYELVSAKDVSEIENGNYGFIIIDSDLYKDDEFGILKDKFSTSKYILIAAKGSERPAGFDVYVEKPFLPTELVEIFTSLASSIPMDDNISEDDVFGDSTFDSFGSENIDTTNNDELASMDEMSFGEDNLGEGELNELDNADFSFDTITDDIKSSLEDDDSDHISLDEPNTELPEYEEITLDPNDALFEESNTQEEGLSLDTDEVNLATEDFALDDTLQEEPSNEISLEDYQSGVGNDDITLDENHGDLDFGSDFSIDSESSNETDDLGDIVISNDEHELFDSIEGEKSEYVMQDMPEVLDDVEEMAASEAQIFDEDEVNKLKDLLDETEEDKLEHDDFDLDNIKIQNDELGSLTEESLAEALGVSVGTDDNDLDLDMDSDIDVGTGFDEEDDMGMGSLDDDLNMGAINEPISNPVANSVKSNNIEIDPSQSITLSLDTIKQLLETADVTINITLSKKK